MTSLPTVNPQSYEFQLNTNNSQAIKLFQALFPDIGEEMVFEVFNIVSYLSDTKVNPKLLPRVIRGVHNVMIGTGHGQVIVHVDGDMSNVSTRETDDKLKTGF